MRFIKQTSNLSNELAQTIQSALTEYKNVLWLIPGGSNIDISVEAMANITAEQSQSLVIAQTDERFVTLGHPDNNWRQLKAAGFKPKQATVYPIILRDDESSLEVSKRYNQTLSNLLAEAGHTIGQFGIGADGHIAGAKPNSIATKSKNLVESYQAEDFERVTMTLKAISKLDEAIVFVRGKSKHDVIQELSVSELPVNDFPALVLDSVTKATIYNDILQN